MVVKKAVFLLIQKFRRFWRVTKIKLGIAQRDNNIVTVNTQKLVALVKDNKRWKEDLGLDIYGTVKIFSTDPRRSNSGNMWAGLLVALTNNCKRLEAALQDSQLQQLAWQRHGFRTGLLGVTNNPEVLQIGGIPETINQIIPMPDGRVMQQMMDAL